MQCFHNVYEFDVEDLITVITGLATESLRNLAITMDTKSVLHQLISVAMAANFAIDDL